MKRPLFWWGAALAIWLVILLAPPLNLLFRVQLRGSDAIRFSVLPAPQSERYFWEKAARRFSDDLDILMQAAQEDPFGDAETPTQPSQIFPEKNPTNSATGVLQRLDTLLQKYPNNVTLLALRLRIAFSNMYGGRIGGEMSDGNFTNNQAAGIPSPEVSKEPPTYTKAELQRAIALAARGQKLEPNNGYFDWLKACFLILAWRDGEAFSALDAAASKKRFDDHSLDAQQAKMRARSTALGRPLLLEEKLLEQFNTLYPQYARDREMARIFAWQSLKAQRRGEHALALRITAGLARTAARKRENARTYIEGLVAAAMEAIAWSGPVTDARRRIGGRTTPGQRLSSFSAYAAQHGRPELGAEASKNGAAAAAFQNSVRTSFGAFYGVSYGAFLAAQLLWLAGVAVLLTLPIALLLLVLKPILRRVPRVAGVLRWRNSQPDEVPSAREVGNGALACGGLRALATLLAGLFVVALCVAGLYIGAGQGSEVYKTLSTVWSDGVNSDNWIGLNLTGSSSSSSTQWRIVLALTPLFFGGLFCAWRAAQWQKRRNGETNFSFIAFFKAAFHGKTFRPATLSERDEFDIGGAAIKLVNFVVAAGLSAAWLFAAFWQSSEESGSWLLPFFFVILFSGALLFENFLDWRKHPRRAATARYGLRLFHRSLAAWLVMGSALYLLTLLVSLPVRSRIEACIDRAIDIGEVRANGR
jgi:hypothetical protein